MKLGDLGVKMRIWGNNGGFGVGMGDLWGKKVGFGGKMVKCGAKMGDFGVKMGKYWGKNVEILGQKWGIWGRKLG